MAVGTLLWNFLLARAATGESPTDSAVCTETACSDGSATVLEPPRELLPLHRWPAEPGERKLQLSDGRRVTLRTLHAEGPRIFEVTGLLNSSEAEQLIKMAEPRLQEDLVRDGQRFTSRRSYSAYFFHWHSPLVEVINARAADLTRVPLKFWADFESLNVVQYSANGYYHAHWDSNTLQTFSQQAEHTGSLQPPGGPRLLTLLVFLNNVSHGGETIFPIAGWTAKDQEKLRDEKERQRIGEKCKLTRKRKGVKVKPRVGTALLWYNHLLEDDGQLGELEPLAWHSGCAVKAGSKWVLNRWVPAPLPKGHAGRRFQPDV